MKEDASRCSRNCIVAGVDREELRAQSVHRRERQGDVPRVGMSRAMRERSSVSRDVERRYNALHNNTDTVTVEPLQQLNIVKV